MRMFLSHLIPVEELYDDKPDPDPSWWERAICVKYQSIFLADFAHNQIAEQRANERKAQNICMRCPVRLHCLWEALEVGDKFLIWGGATPDQRNQLRRKLNLKDREEDVA